MTLALFDDPSAAPAPPEGARRDADFYPTPTALWRAFVPVLRSRLAGSGTDCAACGWASMEPVKFCGWCERPMGAHDGLIVEPACGDGRLLDGLAEMGIHRSRLAGVDIRSDAVKQTRGKGYAARCIDWLRPDAADHLPNGGEGCAFVTNPPFVVGLEFARTCIERAGPNGLVALLLRITWLEPTVERAAFLASTPFDVWVSPKRVSFTDGKNTDSATTAWFVWPPEDRREEGHLVRYLGRNDGGQS